MRQVFITGDTCIDIVASLQPKIIRRFEETSRGMLNKSKKKVINLVILEFSQNELC